MTINPLPLLCVSSPTSPDPSRAPLLQLTHRWAVEREVSSLKRSVATLEAQVEQLRGQLEKAQSDVSEGGIF